MGARQLQDPHARESVTTMERNELPAVLNTELRAFFARIDAIEAEAREVRRVADEATKRHRRVFYALNIAAVLVTSQRIAIALCVVALAIHAASFAWWRREETRAQSIDARVRSLWPRIMPLCVALDHLAPRTRKPIPEAS